MSESDDVLMQVAHLSPRERAAALTHWIYMQAARRMNWPTRVPVSWEQLDDQAKEINMLSMDVWAERDDLRGAWLEALAEHRAGKH